jgi:hypothetical protein
VKPQKEMKKYITSFLIASLLSWMLGWAISFTPLNDFSQGVLIGVFGMFVLGFCLEIFYFIEDMDDENLTD